MKKMEIVFDSLARLSTVQCDKFILFTFRSLLSPICEDSKSTQARVHLGLVLAFVSFIATK